MLLSLASSEIMLGQDGYWNNSDNFPKQLTGEELKNIHLLGERIFGTAPPAGNVRAIAEYERSEAVLIRYNANSPQAWPLPLISKLSDYVRIMVLVSSDSVLVEAENHFSNAGVALNKVDFLIAPTNSVWTRDYSPFFIMDDEEGVGMIDFTYNRPLRPLDDAVPTVLAEYLDMPIYNMGIIHTGGNYMSDGYGSAASTDLVFEENFYNETFVKNSMKDYMNIDTYHVTIDPQNSYIKHIDTWSKYLAPDKILIARVPENHPDYHLHEQVVDYFKSQTSGYGTPYKIYRVDTPNGQPYTNALIVNENVFIPLMNNSAADSAAIQSYREAMPGYNIYGFAGNPGFNWNSSDALHCRIKEIPDRKMLHIGHVPFTDTLNYISSLELESEIIPFSGRLLIPESLNLIYWINDAAPDTVILNQRDAHTYTAAIPLPVTGATVSYYLSASDESGRSGNYPLIGKPGAWSFYVEARENLITRTYQKGWNLVGVPAELSDTAWNEYFPSGIPGTLQAFDSGYYHTDAVNPGYGYWLKMNQDHVNGFSGLAIKEVNRELKQGWNLISGPIDTIHIASIFDPDTVLVRQSVFGFQNYYKRVQRMYPGEGYWVYATDEGTIRLLMTDNNTELLLPDSSEWTDYNLVQFESGETGLNLYFGVVPRDSTFMRMHYLLPPQGPLEIFDVRFTGGEMATNSDTAKISIHHTGDPTLLKLSGMLAAQGTKRIRKFSSGELTGDILAEFGESVEIPENVDYLEISEAITTEIQPEEKPDRLELYQNYPNPFNPLTTIRFTIPYSGYVRADVYDINGRHLSGLLDELKEPGEYSIRFNGELYGSGVYVYVIRYENQTIARKMILLK